MSKTEKREIKLLALIGSELGRIAQKCPAAKGEIEDLQALLINYLSD